MAASQFLEEALGGDVDENAVTELAGSLETQLTDTHNGINGIMVQKPGNSEESEEKSLTQLQNATNPNQVLLGPNVITKTGDGVKIVSFPAGSGPQVVRYPNGNVTSAPPAGTTFVIKGGVGTPMTAGGSQTNQTPGTVQLVNMGAVRGAAPQKPGQQPQRLVINSPQVIRPGVGGQQQVMLQTLQQLQSGGGNHILVKTESGQLQLIRVGPPQPATTAAPTGVRLQTVSAPAAATTTGTPPALAATTPAQKQQVDTTKEKCRKFLANLLELSTREPKAVERNVRTLIQELIDAKVEPEEFCDRLEKLLNASPQPCLIGFLKKSLPLLRQSLYLRLMTIDGIRPPPQHVVTGITTAVAPGQMPATRAPLMTQTVRVVAPQNAAGQSMHVTTPRGFTPQRIVTPVRGQMQVQGKVLTPLRAPLATATQPPPLHPTTPMVRLSVPKPGAKTATKTVIGARLPLRPAAPTPPKTLSSAVRRYDSASFGGDDDINDVAAMGGVNLAEESQRILGSTEFVGTQIRSVKDETFLHSIPLQSKVRQIVQSEGLEEPPPEVLALISHACQERLKTLVEKLACIAEHRIDVIKLDPRYMATQDVKGQLKFLEELDRLERKRHVEHEREMLLRAAKSRSKSEDPEQVKLKAKAKEMQRAEMEELRQREANITALQAIGPRKKPRLDMPGSSSEGTSSQSEMIGGFARPTQPPIRPRLKRVNLRDLLFLLEQEREPARTKLLYKSYLK